MDEKTAETTAAATTPYPGPVGTLKPPAVSLAGVAGDGVTAGQGRGKHLELVWE